MQINTYLADLKTMLDGELHFDDLMKSLYATDASVYRMLPLAVAFPKHDNDIKELIRFASAHKTSLIPRTAGTSLAGQCVGKGIVVDVSKYFTKILNINEKAQTVTVQPGVVRDELNNYLKPYGLFFGPNTSTSNRCMIGGMVGNNSSGTTSIQYGVTRDKVLELKTILTDGSEAVFGAVDRSEYKRKMLQNTLEGSIYKTLHQELNSETAQKEIRLQFPKPEIHRRNTGYAIDELIKTEMFSDNSEPFNMCKILTGSEGTLAFTTQITLQLDRLPPMHSQMIAAHFESIENCLNAVEELMQHKLQSCEMLDSTILELTKHNKTQSTNRVFIEGEPKALLLCELKGVSEEDVEKQTKALVETLIHQKLSYAFPILKGVAITKALELRKAGLGLLGNMIGDKKAVACIEDTAVSLSDLSSYIQEFSALMKTYNQKAVYYAHAGAGELHLRPILNLKQKEDVVLFKRITTEVAHLVKKYQGSMSGEHGDGIVRTEFIPMMIGDANYRILERIKTAFDPQNIFNPGKIVNAFPMDEALRYETDRAEPIVETLMDFSASEGILREAEKCNGSGDCRKLPEFGGTMCPSYRATRDEKDSTRARANALREFLTHSDKPNRFNHEDLKSVFDLCLSCKACSSECPSSVDVAALKAEFQYQYQKENGYSFRNNFFANATKYNRMASRAPKFFNALLQGKLSSGIIKTIYGIDNRRSLPKITSSYSKLIEKPEGLGDLQINVDNGQKSVVLFVDEFTNYLESNIANDAKQLLESLGYNIHVINHLESGRSFLSKGFLEEAKALIDTNVSELKHLISEEVLLIGIEPSAILTFKDETLRLANDKSSAEFISRHTYLIEEFIQHEFELGHITSSQFTSEHKTIKFHGHCHQKAMANQMSSFTVLNIPEYYKVTIIPSGCCGMAGSFGYEKEHYKISMQIGEQTLFPSVRNAKNDVIIAANGTSCRHQIKDGTNKIAKHPVTILKEALI